MTPRIFLGVGLAKDILTTADAAGELKVSPRRVLALITTGRLPAVKFGGSYAIRRADLAKVRDRKPGRPKGNRAKRGS